MEKQIRWEQPYTRRDGGRLETCEGGWRWRPAKYGDEEKTFAAWTHESAETFLAEIDRLFPLPFPGYRVGQIWAVPGRLESSGDAAGDEWCQLVLAATYAKGDFFRAMIQWNGSGGQIPVQADRIERVLERAFLLHDPLYPERAPWSAV